MWKSNLDQGRKIMVQLCKWVMCLFNLKLNVLVYLKIISY